MRWFSDPPRLWERVLSAAFLLAGVYFLGTWLWQVFGLLAHPIPTEYRDWATQELTQRFAHSLPTYSFDEGPPFFYAYGFLFSALLAPLATIPGVDLELLHKAAVLFFLLAAAALISWEVKSLSRSSLLAFLAFDLMLWSVWNASVPFVVRPDSLGLLLSVALLVVVRRRPNAVGALVAAGLTVAVFYTKAYYLFVAAPILIFYFLARPQLALVYGLGFSMVFATSAVTANLLFPSYFYMSILALSGSVGGTIPYLVSQTIEMLRQYWPLILLVLGISVQSTFSVRTKLAKSESTVFVQRSDKQASLVLYGLTLVAAALCLLYLGTNQGAWMTYYYEMALPPLIVLGLVSLARIRFSFLRIVALLLVIVYPLYHGHMPARSPAYGSATLANWKDARDTLSTFVGSPVLVSSILVGPVLGDEVLFDNGHTEYYANLVSGGSEKGAPVLDVIFPLRHTLIKKYSDHFHQLEALIESGHYALIAVTRDPHPLIPTKTLEEHYRLLREIPLQTGGQVWATQFWVPKQ